MTPTRTLAAIALTAALTALPAASAHAITAPTPAPAVDVADVDAGHVIAPPALDGQIVALTAALVTVEPQSSSAAIGQLVPGMRYPASAGTTQDIGTGMRHHAVDLGDGRWGWVHEGEVAAVVDPPAVLDRIAIKPELHGGAGVGLSDAALAVLTQSAGVRAYPNSNAPVLGEVQPGEAVATSAEAVEGVVSGIFAGASGESNRFRYVRVQGRDLEGWVMEGRIHLVPEASDLFVDAQQRTVSSAVDLRDMPASVGSAVVTTVPAGTRLTAGTTLVDGWTPVRHDGDVLWAQATDLSAGAGVDPSATPTASAWDDLKARAAEKIDDARDWASDKKDAAADHRDTVADKLDPMRPVTRAAGPVLAIVAALVGTLVWLKRRDRDDDDDTVGTDTQDGDL